ncbi:hypothetical protein EJB05_08767 [Eragrostis curvula]|uniref:Uncharacterized protein n=1 Tax=Eragrostis curvula TaxID=38414 RepID=A0A5J9W376_9POAL|nr:hypothetical protein EJB05_08767 [Eragrostis curvula]
MIKTHGERNWVEVAKGVPGRTGKQCRERWVNNLRPGIKEKTKWTEEDDKSLIEAHQICGNSWKAIAYRLGRSENSVKNHWNATRRSLASGVWIKKKKRGQVPFAQFTVLEKYIGSLPARKVGPPPGSEQLGSSHPGHQQQAFPNTFVQPRVSNPHTLGMYMNPGVAAPPQMIQGGVYHPNVLASTASFNSPDIGMYSNAATLAEMQAMQSQVAFYPPTFTDHLNYRVQQNKMSYQNPQGININFKYPVQQNMMSDQDPQGTNINFNSLVQQNMMRYQHPQGTIVLKDPLSENVMWKSYQANSNGFNNKLGGSNAGGNAVPFSETVVRQSPNQDNSNGFSNQVGGSSAVNNIVSLSENAVRQSSNLGDSNGFNNECSSSAGGDTPPFDIDDVQLASILDWFTPFEDDDALDFDIFV